MSPTPPARRVLLTYATRPPLNALALHLAGRGTEVLLLDHPKADLNGLYDRIRELDAPTPLIIPFDPKGGEEDLKTMTDTLARTCPALTGLVHGHPDPPPLSPLPHQNFSLWPDCFRRIVQQPLQLTRHLWPLLSAAENACVIFPMLPAGRRPRPHWSMPGAAYAALENAVQSLALETGTLPPYLSTLDDSALDTPLRHRFYPGETREHLRAPDDPAVMECFLRGLGIDAPPEQGARLTIPGGGAEL